LTLDLPIHLQNKLLLPLVQVWNGNQVQFVRHSHASNDDERADVPMEYKKEILSSLLHLDRHRETKGNLSHLRRQNNPSVILDYSKDSDPQLQGPQGMLYTVRSGFRAKRCSVGMADPTRISSGRHGSFAACR
jgi:hypothetical protein